MFNTFVKILPLRQQLAVARIRFQKVREDFYRETRLDIAAKGLRNTETLFDRLETYEKRSRSRGRIEWQVFARIRETMQCGENFAIAIKPFVPGDEYALLDIADESSREDAVVRGFELAEMAAKAKRVLSATTSVQMAYPALLLVYMYAFCMLFGGVIFPQVLDVRPLDQWPDFGQLLYHVDTFCFEYWWLTLTVLIGLVLAYFASLKRWAGPLRSHAALVAQPARSACCAADRLVGGIVRFEPHAARVARAVDEDSRPVASLASGDHESSADRPFR
ncbi:hypothetical protein [Candidatus Burkholderia verschuerenii]|uniref:hypothetical protein n=1 Tax=Candidatus Burkholderia verschuerenii TaxID=242163 RepID=UPI000B048520